MCWYPTLQNAWVIAVSHGLTAKKTWAVKFPSFQTMPYIFFLENVSRTTNGPTAASPSKSIEDPPEPRILATRIPTRTRIRIVKPPTTRCVWWGYGGRWRDGEGSSERKWGVLCERYMYITVYIYICIFMYYMYLYVYHRIIISRILTWYCIDA